MGKTVGSNNGTLLFSRNGKEYLTYYPLPTQDNFPFEKEKEEQQYKEGQYINGYEKTNLLNGSTEGINCARIYCEYDKNTKTYTLTLAEGDEGQFLDDPQDLWKVSVGVRNGEVVKNQGCPGICRYNSKS